MSIANWCASLPLQRSGMSRFAADDVDSSDWRTIALAAYLNWCVARAMRQSKKISMTRVNAIFANSRYVSKIVLLARHLFAD